jgi:hypothetical protein|nr:MAG TPA: hypothetical protein [Caudoviricetes sp.]
MLYRIVWGIIFLVALAVYLIALLITLPSFVTTGKRYIAPYEKGVMFPLLDKILKG